MAAGSAGTVMGSCRVRLHMALAAGPLLLLLLLLGAVAGAAAAAPVDDVGARSRELEVRTAAERLQGATMRPLMYPSPPYERYRGYCLWRLCAACATSDQVLTLRHVTLATPQP